MNSFINRGGVHKPTEHTTEKMYVFVVTPQKEEVILYQAVRVGLVQQEKDRQAAEAPSIYRTQLNLVKVFVHRDGMKVAKYYYSFYVELDKEGPDITIYSFSGDRGPLIFHAKGNILKPDDKRIPESSWNEITAYRPPSEALQRMVVIKHPDPKLNMRKVMVRR